jgi:hypothetical protein
MVVDPIARSALPATAVGDVDSRTDEIRGPLMFRDR